MDIICKNDKISSLHLNKIQDSLCIQIVKQDTKSLNVHWKISLIVILGIYNLQPTNAIHFATKNNKKRIKV